MKPLVRNILIGVINMLIKGSKQEMVIEPESNMDTTKPLLGFWAGDLNNFQFVNPLIMELSKDYRVRKYIYQDGDISSLENGLKECDLAWFEWANGPVIPASQLQGINTPIICRLHRYEAYGDAPHLINWSRINKLIFISESVEESFKHRFPKAYASVKSTVVRNGVDLAQFKADLTRPRGKKVAYLGRLHYHKNPAMLLQCFAAIAKKDPEYEFHVAGSLHDSVIDEYFRYQSEKLGLNNQIIYYGNINNASEWLKDKDYLLISSIIEGQPVSVLEAMAEGVKPVIHDYFLSDRVFPRKYLFNTIEECVEKVTGDDFNRQEYRDYVESNNDLLKQASKIKEIINNLLSHSLKLDNQPTALLLEHGTRTAIRSSLDAWDIFIPENRFDKAEDIGKFYNHLKHSSADIVRIPVIYPLIENHEIARWEIAAKRKNPRHGSVEKCFCKVGSENEVELPYESAYLLFHEKRFEEALKSFVAAYQSEPNPQEKAVYLRWIVLCLIELERDNQAINILEDALQIYEDNADIHYLYMLASLLGNKYENIQASVDKIMDLGDALAYPEFFNDVGKKALAILHSVGLSGETLTA